MNPFLGVFFHWLGGLASGSFYVPYKGVRKWSWEVYWLVGGFFSWIICPWILATLMTSDLLGVLRQQSGSTLWWAYFFGAMWGFGGLTFGLTMRYLGMSLGMGVALGYCAAFGTLLPPIFKMFTPTIPVPETIGQIASTMPGQVTLGGVAVCLLGICIAALAGLTKEKEMPAAEKKKAIAEFSFTKGILVATFSGIMSACFAFGMTAGRPIEDTAYCENIIHSSAKQGKTLDMAARVPEEQSANIVQALKDTGFFTASPTNIQCNPNLAAVVEVIEAPAILDMQLTELKTQLSEAAAAKKPEVEKKIAALTTNLLAVTKTYPGQIASLKQATGPLAERLQKYHANIEATKDKPEALSIILGLKDLTRKEVAFSAVLNGVNFVALHKKHQLWTGLPKLVVVLLGGFTTNFVWCVILNLRNRTGYQYFSPTLRPGAPGRGEETIIETAVDAPSEEVVERSPGRRGAASSASVPLVSNYLFSALAGATWYFQFFFYTMGETQMGKFGFASWTLHMASIIIFSTMWGWIFHEWKGSSKKAHSLIAIGIAMLILSTIIIGFGTWLKSHGVVTH